MSWTDQHGNTLANNDPYVDAHGTQYPGNFPKSEIPGLTYQADPAPAPPTADMVWARIKALRDSKTQTGGYLVGAKWYHSDTFSRTQQIGLMMMGAAIPGGLQWKTMDGSFVTMTQTLAAQIFGAAAAQDQANFSRAEVLRGQAYAAADPSTIDITTGWPAIFGG